MSMFALAGIALSLIVSAYYFNGWAPPWLQGAIGLHGSGPGTAQSSAKKGAGDAHYLGSIILTPRRGDKCWERGLDNRNGAMWDKGPVDCDVVPPLKMLQEQAKGLAAQRLKAIGNAFSPKGN
jgi:hypothetical protein